MSYKCEIKVLHDPKFYQNGVAFATEQEAKSYGNNKLACWTVSEDFHVVESDEPVNYAWDPTKGLVATEEFVQKTDKGY